MLKTKALIIFILAIGWTEQDKTKTGLDSKAKAEVEKLVKKYFDSKSEDDKNRVLKDIASYDKPSQADITHFAKLCFDLAKKGAVHDGKSPSKLNHSEYPGKYYIRVPDSAKTKPTPMLIGLHGGGKGLGDGLNIPGIYKGAHRSFEWISVFPEVIKKENGAWNSEREETFVIELIEELKRTYKVDTNRIYLTGHSMGGYGTWSIGGHYADLFAAVNPNSGGVFVSRDGKHIQPGMLPNFKNVPVYCFHADGDKKVSCKSDRMAIKKLKDLKEKYGGYEFTYDEIKADHHHPPSDMKPVLDWMYKKKRDPYPKHVIWEQYRTYKKYFYWLKDESPKKGDYIEAKIKDNKISVNGDVSGLAVLINEKMVDLTKPLEVEANGRTVCKNKIVQSLVTLVETIGARNDPEMYFIAQVRLD